MRVEPPVLPHPKGRTHGSTNSFSQNVRLYQFNFVERVVLLVQLGRTHGSISETIHRTKLRGVQCTHALAGDLGGIIVLKDDAAQSWVVPLALALRVFLPQLPLGNYSGSLVLRY